MNTTEPPATLASFGDVELTRFERWLLDMLSVPAAPHLPEGSRASIQIFRAGRNYYTWSLIVWAARSLIGAVALSFMAFGIYQAVRQPSTPDFVRYLMLAVLAFAWAGYLGALVSTLLTRRLAYLLRWYIVTDRSLRIRHGIFSVEELTMTYSNIQEVRVASGPLQQLLGLADVEVQAAGGGGGSDKTRGRGNLGRFVGLANANEIRDLLVDRLRRYRDAGLGDTPTDRVTHPADHDDEQTLHAAQLVLQEARALRSLGL